MPIITLTSDFGTRDAFVAAVKGVILSLTPEATLVDVTHEIPPQDIWAGALALAQAAPTFPPGTVHMAVVDPDVGSERAGIVIDNEIARFLGPDNGLLTLAVPPGAKAYRIEDTRLLRAPVSATFHGRDVFAPIAARLARGLNPALVGSPLQPRALAWPAAPQVVAQDRFGNLILSLRNFPKEARAIEVDGLGLAPLLSTYCDVAPGQLVAYLGSAGLVEVARRNGSAAETLGSQIRGRPVRVIS